MKYHSTLLCPTAYVYPSILSQLRADVVFGSPKRNCAGSGICRMLARTGARRAPFSCPSQATLLRALRPDWLLLECSVEGISPEQWDLLFGGSRFRVETTFRLPLTITRPLFGHRVEIPAGNYPFTLRGKRLFIHLSVVPSRRADSLNLA